MNVIVEVSDLQCPFQHKGAVSALGKFIKDYKPDGVVCVGDEIDMPQVSRWNKGLAGEYAGKLAADRDETVRTLELLRVQHIMRSNHGDRLQNYLKQYAPGLADDPDLQYRRYMRYDDLGITFHEEMYEYAPGWLLAHGDEGSLSSIAGTTAAKLARRSGKSVTCGHTHRAGIQPESQAHNGRFVRTLYGKEIGCLMNLKQAAYLKTGGANWQLAFGVSYVDGRKVTPQIVFMQNDGSFVFERRLWAP